MICIPTIIFIAHTDGPALVVYLISKKVGVGTLHTFADNLAWNI